MPNVSLATGFRVAAIISFSWIANAIATAPVSGQVLSGNPYDQNRVFGYSTWWLIELEESGQTVAIFHALQNCRQRIGISVVKKAPFISLGESPVPKYMRQFRRQQ